MSIKRSSSKGVPSNSTAGGKKSLSDGAWNSPAIKVTLSVLSRGRNAGDSFLLRFDRTLTIWWVDSGRLEVRQQLWQSRPGVCTRVGDIVDGAEPVTQRARYGMKHNLLSGGSQATPPVDSVGYR
ncbi:hypothetical protein GCM10027167_88190 [Nocardia heshunensis]